MNVFCVMPLLRHYAQALVSRDTALRTARERGLTVDWLVMVGQDAGDPYAVVTAKYQRARDMFLAGNWDVFISIEDDHVIPPDTIERLLAVLDAGADIAYGLYVLRSRPHRWNVATYIDDHNVVFISDVPGAIDRAWGQVVDCAGVGMGIAAITRRTLECIPFERRGDACCDWYLAVDAERMGLRQRVDCSLVCGHITDGQWTLWPTTDGWEIA